MRVMRRMCAHRHMQNTLLAVAHRPGPRLPTVAPPQWRPGARPCMCLQPWPYAGPLRSRPSPGPSGSASIGATAGSGVVARGSWTTGSWAAARWGNSRDATTEAPSTTATTPRARPDRDLVDVGEQHLGADEDQHHRQAELQVVEPVDDAGQQEVERPQAEDGEDVRGVDDERVAGDGEDRRDGVDGEDQVGRLHQHQHHEERRRHQPRRLRRRARARRSAARGRRRVTGTRRRTSRSTGLASGSMSCSLCIAIRMPVKTRKAPKT